MATVYLSRLCLVSTNTHCNIITIFKQSGSIVGSHAVLLLATMILLSYTKQIRTVFQVHYFINIQYNGNNNVIISQMEVHIRTSVIFGLDFYYVCAVLAH